MFVFSGNENLSTTRGTDQQKYKARITIVSWVNADGSHSVSVRYIGNFAEPRCLRDLRFSSSTLDYDSQKNAWIDSARFDKKMKWWYAEVQKRTTESILLIMYYCGGHESFFDYPGLRVEFLPPNSTHKYQPIDLGPIVYGNIRYRTSLLSQVVNDV